MIDELGATKTRLFGKKSEGTPNPQVKKVGVTPNPDQIFTSAAARAAPAGRGASRASGGRRENLIRVRGYPHFFDLWVRGTPTFLTENVEFSAKTPRTRNVQKDPKVRRKSQIFSYYVTIWWGRNPQIGGGGRITQSSNYYLWKISYLMKVNIEI